jgi:ABC-type Fe3+ transport system permease subunit
VLGLSLRRLGQEQLDALTLSGAGPIARARVLTRAMLPGLAGAFAVVFLLMLGSPVPLHVAQFDTYAVALWRRLNETGDPVRVWIAAWPVVLVAGAIAVLMTRDLSRRLAIDADPRPSLHVATPSRSARGALWLVLALSLLLPLFLHALATAPPGTTFSFHALIHTTRLFWRESSGALAESSLTATCCAATHLVIALATWAALACTPRRRRSLARTIALVAVAIFLAAAITPGAILGSMAAGAWTNIAPLRALADTPLPVICTHTARFGAIAALLGAWAALLEPPALRDLRELDAPGSLRAFFRVCLRANWPVPIAAGVAGFVLSLHEIESTVFVQPPGSGALAQKLLDALHYSRDDRLGAATITLALASLVLAYTAAWLGARPRGSPADYPASPAE